MKWKQTILDTVHYTQKLRFKYLGLHSSQILVLSCIRDHLVKSSILYIAGRYIHYNINPVALHFSMHLTCLNGISLRITMPVKRLTSRKKK